MDTLNNAIFLKIKAPITDILSRSITFLLDDGGKIIDSASPIGVNFFSVFEQINAHGNIKKFFRLEERDTLSKIAGSAHEFFAYLTDIHLEEVIEPIYTSHPVLVLRLYPVEEDRVVGIINFTNIVPTHFEPSSGSLLYINDKGRLAGFYHAFYEHFGGRYDKPQKMLNEPVSNFFTPTPMDIQNEYLNNLRLFSNGEYEKHFERSYPSEEDGRRLWSVMGPQGATFTIKEPVDANRDDFRVRFEFEPKQGHGPLVIFGELETRSGYLDDNGYSLGPRADGRAMVIKRRGLNIAVFPWEQDAEKIQTWEVQKIGSAFIVTVQGRHSFGHYDLDFLPSSAFYISLYLRKGSACLIKRLSVEIKPCEAVPRNRTIVVKGNNQNYYLLNPFYSIYLSSTGLSISGYRLQDITEFQNRVKDLEIQQKKQVQVEMALRDMIEKEQKEKNLFVGNSREISVIKEKAIRIAGSPATLLLQGPTGTGKEVLARFIHDNSLHARGSFVKVDCSTIPKSLMESELFGYEPGAFTGAQKRKIGLLEQADQGTLFLDELNNLTLETQTKLLQLLQDQTITRVGGRRLVKLNTRIITASNRNLEEMVRQGLFREDLFYRIAVITFVIPPLRARMDDLAELAHFFLAQFNQSYRKEIGGFSPPAMKKMYDYEWPGNIRELRNVIEQAVLFSESNQIQPEHLAIRAREPVAGTVDTEDRRRKIILSGEETKALLEKHGGHVIKAARALGVTRRAIYFHLKKLGFVPNAFRKRPHRR